jgi:recombination protein RecT
MSGKEIQKTTSVKGLLSQESVQNRFKEMLGQKANGFLTSVITAVSQNSLLQKADPQTVLFAAAAAASMDLPVNPNLGLAYIVPYKGMATLQVGYKGFIQLAQRSGQYRTINATDVREGEVSHIDRLSGEMDFNWIQNDAERIKKKVVGYVAYFELLNGFKKSLYMSETEIRAHAKKYSQSFKSGTGIWADEFDGMAKKTVIKLLLSKFGVMSIDMQTAITVDQGVVKNWEGEAVEYVDNKKLDHEQVSAEKENQRLIDHISESKDINELEMVEDFITEGEIKDLYDKKKKELQKA